MRLIAWNARQQAGAIALDGRDEHGVLHRLRGVQKIETGLIVSHRTTGIFRKRVERIESRLSHAILKDGSRIELA